MGLFDKFKYSLAKTRAAIVGTFVSPQWSPEEMERALIGADFGPRLASEIVANVRKHLETNMRPTTDDAIVAAKQEIENILEASGTGNGERGTGNAESEIQNPVLSSQPTERAHSTSSGQATRTVERGTQPSELAHSTSSEPETQNLKPKTSQIILLVGVNGTGKTTTVAKLAHLIQQKGGKVLLAAADTFRAAAIDQLKAWGQRLNVEVVAGNYGTDPGAVAFDAVQRLQKGEFTHLLIDTAGRQHTKSNLMQELQKVKRVIAKAMPVAPHETWLVVDAPTGGNALVQAREFHAAMELTGIIITKLDGTAKGGIVVAIRKESGLPIRYVGLGESVEDIEPFDAKAFAEALWTG